MSRPTPPASLELGTWNALRDRADGAVHGDVVGLLRAHPVDALAIQEAGDYLDVLDHVPGYRMIARTAHQGDSENVWLVRAGVPARDVELFDLGGDGWTTVTGHHHVGLKALGVELAGWLLGYSLHLPPSIDWHDGNPTGPPDRVDDLVRAMQRLRTRANRERAAGGRLVDVRQRGHFGSDHPAVTFTVRRLQSRKALLYVGDWNCRPGRDEGAYSVSWLARQANMRVGVAPNLAGHLAGIDVPLLKQPAKR